TLVLDRPVTISAEQRRGSVTIEPPTGSAVVMATEAATLTGLVLRNPAGGDGERRPTVDVGRGRLRLEECEVAARSTAAVYVRDGAELVGRDCRLSNPVGAGVVAVDNAGGLLEQTEISDIGTSG